MEDSDRIAILGGTFTPIHNGHRALLHKAFQAASHVGDTAGHVIVGLTSTELAKQTREHPDQVASFGSFDERHAALASELTQIGQAYSASHEIIRIDSPAGPAATRDDLDALVVSPEAKAQRRARQLNQRRIDDGRSPLEVYTAPFVTAEDGTRISSTRIRNGEIDSHGRLVSGEH